APDVARERDLGAAAEGRTVDRGDGREGKRGEVVEHTLHRAARTLCVGLRAAAEHVEIGPGDELRRLRAGHDEAARRRDPRGGDGGGEILEYADVERVDAIVGPVDDDPGDTRLVRRHEGDAWTRRGRRRRDAVRGRDHAARSSTIAAPLPPAAQTLARP